MPLDEAELSDVDRLAVTGAVSLYNAYRQFKTVATLLELNHPDFELTDVRGTLKNLVGFLGELAGFIGKVLEEMWNATPDYI